jgi:hypothetical protein
MINNVEIFEQFDSENNSIKMVRIDKGNNEFTVMPKEHYDKQLEEGSN